MRNEPESKKIVAIAGGKGGIGKTVLTAALGILLADADHTVAVVDMDLGGANLHHVLGMPAPKTSIKSFILRHEQDINNLLVPTDIPGLRLLPGSSGDLGLANARYSTKLKIIRNLKHIDADWVLLDLGAGTSFNQLDFFNAAHQGIIVTTPDPMSIQDGFNFIKLALYRRLYKTLSALPNVEPVVRQLLSKNAAKNIQPYSEIRQQIVDMNSRFVEQWDAIVADFKPSLVINRIQSEEDFLESTSLQIAVRELLSVDLSAVDYINSDDHFRNAALANSPGDLLRNSKQAINDLRRVLEHVLLGNSAAAPLQDKASAIVSNPVDTVEKNKTVICSVRCGLWGNCSMQMGGYPCRIPAVGFVHQK